MKKHIYELTNEEIDEYIKTHLPIKQLEKDKYGEVFTPPELTNKLLELYPKQIWTNPDTKWLEPSAGVGFIMIMIYQRLMNGLKKWESSDKKRSKHIIEKMLYMVELNDESCNKCKSLFGVNANIICGDFLEEFEFKNLNIKNLNNTFDCIIGNPPFQDDYGLSEKGKRINGGKSKLYERIFLKAYSLLKNDGYLTFIVPDNIFSGNGSESYKTLIQNDIPFISFNQTFFQKIQQPICYFLLHKTKQNSTKQNSTIIENNTITENNKQFTIILEDRPVNPIRNWTPETEKYIKKYVSNKRNMVHYNRGANLKMYRGKIYPIIYSPLKTLYTNNLDLAVGLGTKKAIIFAISVDLSFKMDYSGKYGVGPNTFYVPFETIKEGKRIESFLNSEEYKTLALATKTTRQYLKLSFIEYLNFEKIIQGKGTRKMNISRKKGKGTRKRRPLK
jgi:hypothetical protein